MNRLSGHNPLFDDEETKEDQNPFAAQGQIGGHAHHGQPHTDDVEHYTNQEPRWESSFRVEIPEFHGGPLEEALLDWIVAVDEVLEFKKVPDERRVPLVAMKFRGHVASWWKHVKVTRQRTSNDPIRSSKTLAFNIPTTYL